MKGRGHAWFVDTAFRRHGAHRGGNSLLAANSGNVAMMTEAMARFHRNAQRAPEHPANWQNWAVALYYTGNYAGAWEKLEKIEKLGLSSAMDPRFLQALSARMARPAAVPE